MTIVPASRKEKGVIKRVYPKTSDRAVNLSDGRKLTEFVEEIKQNKKSIEDINSTITSINVDEFSPVITQTTSMGKIGKDDNIDVSANVNDGFFKSAILKGQTLVNRFDFEPIFEQRSGGNWDIENKGNGVYIITAKKDRAGLRGWFINHPEVDQTHTMIFEVFENTATTGYTKLWARTQMTDVAYTTDGTGFEAGETGVYKLVGRGRIAGGYAIVFEGNWNTGESITFRLTWLDGDHYYLNSGFNIESVKMPVLKTSNLFYHFGKGGRI